MIYKAEINGIGVEAYYSEESVKDIFIPLLQRLSGMYEEKGKRIIVMLAAPPGAGKSTLVHFLGYLSERTEGVRPILPVGMDGFHHYQDYLDTHTMMRAGQAHLMKEYKGAPETFDLTKLTEKIRQISEGEDCGWPEYYRIAHNPIEDAIQIHGDIILIEGNYLLLNLDGWKELREYADYTIKIIAHEALLKNRLVDRKAMSGISREEAEAFVENSDLYNVRTCLKYTMDEPDLTLQLMEDDSLTLFEKKKR